MNSIQLTDMAKQFVLDKAECEGCSQEEAVFLILNSVAVGHAIDRAIEEDPGAVLMVKNSKSEALELSRGCVQFLGEGECISVIEKAGFSSSQEEALPNFQEMDYILDFDAAKCLEKEGTIFFRDVYVSYPGSGYKIITEGKKDNGNNKVNSYILLHVFPEGGRVLLPYYFFNKPVISEGEADQ